MSKQGFQLTIHVQLLYQYLMQVFFRQNTDQPKNTKRCMKISGRVICPVYSPGYGTDLEHHNTSSEYW